MATKEEETILTAHLIEKYRESIAVRYEYNYLNERFELSSQVNEDVINALKYFFLVSLYPVPEERHKMDEAFDSLHSFVSHPTKTWKLLGNMTRAIFRFGTQFPKAIKAGVISLETYVNAKRFEKDLLQAAQKSNFKIPLTTEQFETCIAHINRKDLDAFTNDVVQLFKSIANSKLLKKTIAILTEVVEKMKADTKTYTQQDIDGIELGLDILQTGYDLFENYPESLKKEIIVAIDENERGYLERIFNHN